MLLLRGCRRLGSRRPRALSRPYVARGMRGRFARLIDWWRRRHWSRRPRYGSIITVADHASIPDPIPRQAVVVVGQSAKWAVFECPCGNGHRVTLNLAHQGGPRWQLTATPRLSLNPSIDVLGAQRRCHFWIRDGRAKWVAEERNERTRRAETRLQQGLQEMSEPDLQ